MGGGGADLADCYLDDDARVPFTQAIGARGLSPQHLKQPLAARDSLEPIPALWLDTQRRRRSEHGSAHLGEVDLAGTCRAHHARGFDHSDADEVVALFQGVAGVDADAHGSDWRAASGERSYRALDLDRAGDRLADARK